MWLKKTSTKWGSTANKYNDGSIQETNADKPTIPEDKTIKVLIQSNRERPNSHFHGCSVPEGMMNPVGPVCQLVHVRKTMGLRKVEMDLQKTTVFAKVSFVRDPPC